MLLVVSVSHLFSFEITAAARALKDFPDLSAEEVTRKAMDIASDMCIHTNKVFLIELLDEVEDKKEE
jgi:ATP-dependent HslUV protease subunit HslV